MASQYGGRGDEGANAPINFIGIASACAALGSLSNFRGFIRGAARIPQVIGSGTRPAEAPVGPPGAGGAAAARGRPNKPRKLRRKSEPVTPRRPRES